MATEKRATKQAGEPLNLRITPTLKKRFRLWAIENETTMTHALVYWIEQATHGKLDGPPSAKPPKRR